MDITLLFKACVKTVRTTNKDLGLANSKTNILKTTPKDANMAKPREILKHVSNLHTFFEENRVEYLNVVNYLSTKKAMNEMDREQIDKVSQNVLSTCTTMIKEYRQEMDKIQLTSQKRQHYMNVIDFIDAYVKDVSKMYANTKAARIKRLIETSKIAKLESPLGRNNTSEIIKPLNANIDRKSYDVIEKELDNDRKKVEKKVEFNPPPVPAPEDELSAEEMQMFEAENEQLYNNLNNLSDEVKQMENKVVHIAELQELFTEKVLQQEKDIERISHVVASTTDDVKDANEQIRQAIQRNAGLRVWVLFFLLIMSFSLLFLDWYND